MQKLLEFPHWQHIKGWEGPEMGGGGARGGEGLTAVQLNEN
jgi:hypothetical protein